MVEELLDVNWLREIIKLLVEKKKKIFFSRGMVVEGIAYTVVPRSVLYEKENVNNSLLKNKLYSLPVQYFIKYV